MWDLEPDPGFISWFCHLTGNFPICKMDLNNNTYLKGIGGELNGIIPLKHLGAGHIVSLQEVVVFHDGENSSE